MGSLLDLLKGPIDSLLGNIGAVFDDLHMSGEEKAKAKMELAKLQNDFNLKLMEADYKFAQEQSKVLTAEIASNSWMARNWRPIIMLLFGYIVAHNFVIAPLFGLEYLPIPGDLWDLLKIGIGGYIVGRSAEKIIPTTKLSKD